MKAIASALLLALLAPTASADFITGRVVDQNGVGVGGVDIDVKNVVTGETPTIFNDGTDPDGFFTTTLPAGLYEVTFTPPPPPVTTHLVLDIEPVAVVGTTAMGVIALPAGVSLSGHIENTAGLPVAGVNLDVIDETTGEKLETPQDTTDPFGNFEIAVPAGPIEFRVNARPVIGQTLVSTAIELTPGGNTVLPDITLENGFVVQGIVRDSGGGPVENTDLDVYAVATGAKLYTPGDNTSATGAFNVIVGAGLWDVQFCPDPEDLLVAEEIKDLAVSSATNLGVVSLQDGEVLQGTVRDSGGAIVVGADVDVSLSSTGASVVLCGDNTNSSGQYSVVVPAGTLDVHFRPPNFFMGLGSQRVTGVGVAGTTTRNGVLPACAPASNYGAGLAGKNGVVPRITTGGGVPSEGNSGWSIEMEDGLGGALAILVLSRQQVSVSGLGGTILVNISAAVSFDFVLTLDGPAGVAGAGSASFPVPSLVGFAGFTGYAQFAVRDPAAPKGWALSEGLAITFCP